jgi:hypothetical protein
MKHFFIIKQLIIRGWEMNEIISYHKNKTKQNLLTNLFESQKRGTEGKSLNTILTKKNGME